MPNETNNDANNAPQPVDPLIQKATEGDAEAQYLIGQRFVYGTKGFPQDDVQALPWLEKAAMQGHAGALALYGYMHYEGRGVVAPDMEVALKAFGLAAAQGNSYGLCNLGLMFANGYGGVETQENRAMAFVTLAAAQENESAQSFLKELLEAGVPAQTLAVAQGIVGHVFENGIGVDPDPTVAVTMYGLAAAQEDSSAQYMLGRLFHKQGDYNNAIALYRLAAEQNHEWAKAELEGFKANGHQEQSMEEAQHGVGWIFEQGLLGVPKNSQIAMEMYKRSADAGYEPSRLHLEQYELSQQAADAGKPAPAEADADSGKPAPEETDADAGKPTPNDLHEKSLEDIKALLDGLALKIGQEQHHITSKAQVAARRLLNDLNEAWETYSNDLHDILNDSAGNLQEKSQQLKNIQSEFKSRCATAISVAQLEFKNDLGWNDYFTNFLKALMNALAPVVTFGTYHTFFEYARSESSKVAEDIKSDLDIKDDLGIEEDSTENTPPQKGA